MMWDESTLLIRKISVSITRTKNIDIYVESVQVQITLLKYYVKDINLYVLLCDTKFNNQIITRIKANLCNSSVGF